MTFQPRPGLGPIKKFEKLFYKRFSMTRYQFFGIKLRLSSDQLNPENRISKFAAVAKLEDF